MPVKWILPQPGPQTQFLASPADIVIYGGAAGGGKSFALLLEALRYINVPGYTALILRKNSRQLFAPGGLWETASSIYSSMAKMRMTPEPCWVFPSGAKIVFSFIGEENELEKWQGSQITLLCFDELTHFTRRQFFYMLSRNRSTCGVPPYVRATCNPDSESWVREFINWWIDPDTGYAIPQRSGQIRWLFRDGDALHWADSPDELHARFGLTSPEQQRAPKQVSFIASTLADNRILTRKDPGYLANLLALPTVERERLLNGNWKIRPGAGTFFSRARINIIHELPGDIQRWVRAWDMAATPSGTAACTAGVLMGKRQSGHYVIADVFNQRLAPPDVRLAIANTAALDNARFGNVRIRLNQDPGQAGKDQAEQYARMLSGYSISIVRESGSKQVRAEPFSSQWQLGNAELLAADWNEPYIAQLETFPEGKLMDMVDASSTAFIELEQLAAPARFGGLGKSLGRAGSFGWRG